MTAAASRTARLVLVTPEGSLIGCLPPIPVKTPYWQDISPVVEAAWAHFGIDVIVLRLLETEILGSWGGDVTYLAEAPASFDSSALPLRRGTACSQITRCGCHMQTPAGRLPTFCGRRPSCNVTALPVTANPCRYALGTCPAFGAYRCPVDTRGLRLYRRVWVM